MVDDVNNYSPITLLPILSKFLKKNVPNQMTSFLEANNISQTQHDLRNRLFTETVLSQITDKIYETKVK